MSTYCRGRGIFKKKSHVRKKYTVRKQNCNKRQTLLTHKKTRLKWLHYLQLYTVTEFQKISYGHREMSGFLSNIVSYYIYTD